MNVHLFLRSRYSACEMHPDAISPPKSEALQVTASGMSGVNKVSGVVSDCENKLCPF